MAWLFDLDSLALVFWSRLSDLGFSSWLELSFLVVWFWFSSSGLAVSAASFSGGACIRCVLVSARVSGRFFVDLGSLSSVFRSGSVGFGTLSGFCSQLSVFWAWVSGLGSPGLCSAGAVRG